VTQPTTSNTPSPYAYTPPAGDGWKILRAGRIALTLLLLVLGAKAFKSEYGEVPLVGSINIAIHEFGHNLFMPFGWQFLGETMVIAGGALTEVAFPALFVAYFLYGKKEHRDLHGAMVCLWWTSIALLNVSVYAADARARQLMLISGVTGQEDDTGHDFYNLFSRWGVLQRDTIYAGRMRALAFLMFAASIAVGLYAAWRSRPAPTTTD